MVTSKSRRSTRSGKMTKDIHMLVSMINMKLRDDDMKLVHALSIYD